MKNAKILVIEDKNSATMSITPKLEGLGFTVLAIESSRIKALKDFRKLKPDLILMDINSTCIKSITKIRDCFNSPIIYLTIHSDTQMLNKLKLTDQSAYLIKKGLSDSELKNTVENALYNSLKSKLNDSNKNLNAFLSSVNEPAFLIDLNGNILFTNEYTEKILGKVFDSNIYELLPPNIAAYRKKYVEIAIKTKRVTCFEDERYGKNYEYRIYPVLDEKNEVSKLSVIGLNVTERKTTENALKESEKRFKATFENVAVGMTLTDSDMNFIQVNQTLSKITGYSKEELISINFYDIIHLDDLKTIKKLLKLFLDEKQENVHFESRCIHKQGHIIWADVDISILHSDKSFCFIAHIQDITERKKIEYELKENQRTLETLISNLPGVVYRCKNDPTWTMEFVSEGCFELTGYQTEDLIRNKNISYEDLIHHDDRQMVWNIIQKALKENKPFKITYRIITADLKEKYVWEQGRGIFSPEGELIALEGFITDITKRMKAEEALKKSELYYRTIFENTGTATLIAGEDTIISLANTECEKLSGYCKEEIEGKKSWMDFAVEEDLGHLLNYHRLRGNGHDSAPKNYEIMLITKHGDIRDVYVTIESIPYTKNRVISLLDITDKKRSRKALRESETKFREIFNNANDMITVCELHENMIPGRFIEVNNVALEILGYSKEEFLNMTPFDIVHPDINTSLPKIESDMSKNGYASHESVLIAKDSSEVPVEVATHSFKLQGREVVLAISRDITERKKSEDDVKASLKEKELLLREIHHRVKNNLQIISSLLSLQKSYIQDDETLDVLEESQNRVKSMAIVHEKLYNSESLVKIDFKDYIKDLTDSLLLTYRISQDMIKLDRNVDTIFFDVNTAIPCGLIINELVTNSLKHAFSKPVTPESHQNKEINVELHQEKDNFVLIVSDNGSGLPENLDFKNTESLGLRLVNNLVKQLEGTIKLDETEGTKFKIIFKELKYKERI